MWLRRTLSLVVMLAAAALVPACKSPCRELSEKLCECAPNTNEKDRCNRRVANEESRVSPSSEDEQRCEALLDPCDCHLVNTPEGKEQCGLARVSELPQ